MRNSLSILILLVFLGACGTPSHQTPFGTPSPSTTGAPPTPGTGSQSNSSMSYLSNSGTVSSLNAVSGNLQPAGSFISPDAMGSGCYYGGCPAWQFDNYHFSYELPDGTTADFTNFSGTADFTDQSNVKVKATASGNDSTGTPVQVAVSWAWAAFCRSGRDGGCRKQYISGALSIKK